MDYDDIISWLEAHANTANVAGMARFGITPAFAYGIPMSGLRPLAK